MALNILIVDDSETTRNIIAKSLVMAGVDIGEIYFANNGKDALGLLEQRWVDLLFTDINMPIMGGMELVKQMSDSDLLKTIPVIVVSTEGSETRINELKSQGIRAYIRKPFTPELLKETVTTVLGEGHERKAS